MSPGRSIRVLIADDHPVVRTGLALMIKYEEGMEAVAQVSNGAECVKLYREHMPDVVLMDLKMPEMDGVQATAAILSEFPAARIILLTTYDGDDDIYRGLRAGARAYLLKDASCSDLLETIRIVHTGKKHITREVGAKLAERLDEPELTERERDVLRLMARGKSNVDIGDELCITEGTVKFHINHILSKLSVNDRTQAVIVALKRGMVSLG